MSDDLSTATQQQLEVWAFGRQGVVTDRELAEAALRELARRAALVREVAATETHLARLSLPVSASAPAADDNSASYDDDDGSETDARPRGMSGRSRVVVAIAVITALVIAVFVAQPLLRVGPPGSLDVFERPFTSEERDLLRLLQSKGQTVSVGPRVLGVAEFGTVMAYRQITGNPVAPDRDVVCLAVSEFDRRLEVLQIADWQCVDRDLVQSEGAEVTLVGLGGTYQVSWGPRGDAVIEVSVSEAQRLAMDPGFESIFIDTPASDLDDWYITEQPLLTQSGLLIENMRNSFPLARLLAEPGTVLTDAQLQGGEWIAAYTAVLPDGSDRVVCIGVLTDGVQAETDCVTVDDFSRSPLLLGFERFGRTITVSWAASGELSVLVG